MAELSILKGPPLAEEPGLGALTLPGFLKEVCQKFGPQEALVDPGPEETRRWTYDDLWSEAYAVARSLVALGLGKGERVGILMTNRAEFLAAVFGTALAGGVAAPMSTFSTAHELEHLLELSACSVLLFERRVLKKDFAQMLDDLEPEIGAGHAGEVTSQKFPFLQHLAMVDDTGDGAYGIESWSAFLARGEGVPKARVSARAAAVVPADPGVLFFSSGSTAKPKGILSAHRGVSIQLWRMRGQQALDSGVRSWTANGFFWSGNFAMIVGGTLAAGGSLILQRTFDPEEALDLMDQEKASFLFCWPHQWEQLVAAKNWSDVDLSSLVHIDTDTPIAKHPTVRTDWIEPRNAYGNTETFTLSTGYPANAPRDEGGINHGPPLPGNTLKIVDPLSGDVVPMGARGEIAIKGPTLMLGFVGTPLDNTLDAEGFFRTGDGGFIDERGRLVWEGRLNDIIKTGGANVSPVEIDEVLREHSGIKLVQTVGVPHETLGELAVACVVPHVSSDLTEEELREFAKQKLASYKVPRRVLFFEEADLQLTGSAKIKTADLRKLAGERL